MVLRNLFDLEHIMHLVCHQVATMIRYNVRQHGDMHVFELKEEPMTTMSYKNSERCHPASWVTRKLGEHTDLWPRVLWEIGGPAGSKIAWITCYECHGKVFIVQTYHDSNEKEPSFGVFLPTQKSTRVGSLKTLVDYLRNGKSD